VSKHEGYMYSLHSSYWVLLLLLLLSLALALLSSSNSDVSIWSGSGGMDVQMSPRLAQRKRDKTGQRALAAERAVPANRNVRSDHGLAVVAELEHLGTVLVRLAVQQVGTNGVERQHVVLQQRCEASLLQLGG